MRRRRAASLSKLLLLPGGGSAHSACGQGGGGTAPVYIKPRFVVRVVLRPLGANCKVEVLHQSRSLLPIPCKAKPH